LNNEEKIEVAGKKKEEGNALFKLGKYARASKRYEKVHNLAFYFSILQVVSSVWLFALPD
jgi:FK506-binding protein 4/5